MALAHPGTGGPGTGPAAGRRRCLVVEHAEPETPGLLGRALEAAGAVLDVRPVFAGAGLPAELSGYDGLLVMGGPVSARDDDGFPSRRRELDLLAEAVARGVPALGVCLGAQLLALATGGAVLRGAAGPEIGWGTVTVAPEAAHDHLLGGLGPTFPVLHWHGDTFRPGPDGVLLASSGRYPAQALRVGAAAWGLQFHLEVDQEQVERFVTAFPDDAALAEGGARGISAGTPQSLATLAPVARAVANRFAALVTSESRPPRLRVPDVL